MFRARVANPRWIASMIRHGYKGAAELSATVDYLFGYDATTGVAEDWMYEQVAQRYLLDDDVAAFMTRSNPWAARAIAERLLEAAERGHVGRARSRHARRASATLPRARGRARGGRRVSRPYPLSAIVGQEALIEALLVNAVSPEVGGVLVRGERGHGEVDRGARAGAAAAAGDVAQRARPFAFAPGELAPEGLVPAGSRGRAAARPRSSSCRSARRSTGSSARSTCGRALDGEQAFEAGLLARAHRGILYVDEVNLLPDHLVDALLDAAASGVVARRARRGVGACTTRASCSSAR